MVDGGKPDAGALGVIRDIVEDRVNTTGVSEPVVQRQGADRIVTLHKGKIREIGTHQELLRRGGIYAKLHRLQYA